MEKFRENKMEKFESVEIRSKNCAEIQRKIKWLYNKKSQKFDFRLDSL